MSSYIVWLIMLIISIIISVWIHEVGHGISYFIQGKEVSTGFNKVGDIHKKPSDVDFRGSLQNYILPWDLGVPITLILAIISTILIYMVSNKNMLYIIAVFAITNSLLRLIPMFNSLLGLLKHGELRMEDEIGTGIMWYNNTGITVLKYLPMIISVLISIICYYFTIKGIKMKVDTINIGTTEFFVATIISFLLSYKFLDILDEFFRINWRQKIT